jgi:hypothetical protein
MKLYHMALLPEEHTLCGLPRFSVRCMNTHYMVNHVNYLYNKRNELLRIGADRDVCYNCTVMVGYRFIHF